jgi:hypothetical protein
MEWYLEVKTKTRPVFPWKRAKGESKINFETLSRLTDLGTMKQLASRTRYLENKGHS